MLLMLMASSIELWPLDKLIPYARNARTHSDAQVAQIAASIKEFGFVNPILAGPDCVIIAGHCGLLAARKLGRTEVPVIVLESLTKINDGRLRSLTTTWRSTPGGMKKRCGWKSKDCRMPLTTST